MNIQMLSIGLRNFYSSKCEIWKKMSKKFKIRALIKTETKSLCSLKIIYISKARPGLNQYPPKKG